MGRLGVIALPLIALVLFNILGHCEMSIYPGLRRKPLQQTLQQPYEVSSDFWAQLMEENARRRLQQQFEQQLELINMQMNRQLQRQAQRERYRQQQEQLQQMVAENAADDNSNTNNNAYEQYENVNREFSYKYPNVELNSDVLRGDRIPFAVGPADPRFYEEENTREVEAEPELDSRALDEYEEYVPEETKQTANDKVQPAASPAADSLDGEGAKDANSITPDHVLAPVESSKLLDTLSSTTFHRIKPQSAAAASMKPAANAPPVAAGNIRHDINALIDKLQKEGKSSAIINGHETTLGHDEQQMVVRQHLGMEGEMGMYVVALIAGVSAAVTVGLIALGIAWYTLHNKTKAAADVEYPAYGVTGPNKDISPSGDRKLAQSAQMYHYQHQKQQIIAMENRQAVEGSQLSDVESDDDNEEGDYTVFECPGLAPTGEMEVKNPLFLDETPVTPLSNTNTSAPTNNITQATPQQPQTMRKTSGKPASTSVANTASSEDKKKKNKK